MDYITLGRTGLKVSRDSFGALPAQRASVADAVKIFRAAFDGGINFFDTARAYTDSEHKVGLAFEDNREQVIIATKTAGVTAAEVYANLGVSLSALNTDYIDIYQFHNPPFVPNEDHEAYQAVKQARKSGKIRYIGITSHRADLAAEAVNSGLYDTLQFPISYLSEKRDTDLIGLCGEKNVGFIAMKALSGGLITDVAAARAFFGGYDNAVPIWGIQRMSELEQLFAVTDTPRVLTEAHVSRIAADKEQLRGDFCRGCGYCMPCPAGINIPWAARMSLLLRRMPYEQFLSREWQDSMAKVERCIHCGKCVARCPYKLNTYDLLKRNYDDYKVFLSENLQK